MLPEGWRLSKLLLILLLTISLGALVAFLLWFFWLKPTNTILTTKKVSSVSPSPAKTVQSNNNVASLPIDPHSSAVKSVAVLYLLSGIIDSIKVSGEGDKTSYEIQILAPTGQLLPNKFIVTEQSANVVSLNQKGTETKYSLNQVKKGNQVLINYYLDLQKSNEGQVTKIAVTQNQ